VIRDVASSRYLDRDRLHYDFAGESYSVKGQAIVPRPPQGQLVVFAETGLLPDYLVDVPLVGAPDLAGLGRHGAWADRGRLRDLTAAAGLVGLLGELTGLVDGVRLHPLVLDEDLGVLSRLVIPPLILDRVVSRPLPV